MNIREVYDNFEGFTNDESDKSYDSAMGAFLSTYRNLKTRRDYRIVLEKFEAYLMTVNKKFWQITSQEAYGFQNFCKDGSKFSNSMYLPNSERTVNDYIRKLKVFYDYIIYITKENRYEGHTTEDGEIITPITFNPFGRIKALQVSREHEAPPKIDEIVVAYKSSKYQKIRMAVLLCGFAGLRASEPSKIKVDGIKVHYGNDNNLSVFNGIKNINVYKEWTFHIESSKMGQTRDTLFILPLMLTKHIRELQNIVNDMIKIKAKNGFYTKVIVNGEEIPVQDVRNQTLAFKKPVSIKKKLLLGKEINDDLMFLLDSLHTDYLNILLTIDKKHLHAVLTKLIYRTSVHIQYGIAFTEMMRDMVEYLNRKKKLMYPFRVSTPYLRSENSKTIKPAMAGLGYKTNFHFHALRHFYATYLSRAGIPIENIQKYLGHASISTTVIYVNKTFTETVNDDLKRLT